MVRPCLCLSIWRPTRLGALRGDDADRAADRGEPAEDGDDHRPVGAPHIMREDERQAGGHGQQAGEVDQRAAAQELVGQQAVDRAVDENADADRQHQRPDQPRKEDGVRHGPVPSPVRTGSGSKGVRTEPARSQPAPAGTPRNGPNVGPWGRVSIGCHSGGFAPRRAQPPLWPRAPKTSRHCRREGQCRSALRAGRGHARLLPRCCLCAALGGAAGRLLRPRHDRAAAARRQPAADGARARQERHRRSPRR